MKIFWILALMVLSGCAYHHGITRIAPATSIPPAKEIENALRSIPGVLKVAHFSHDGRAPIDRLLGTNNGWIEEFAIRGDKFGFSLRFRVFKEKKSISMEMMTRDTRPVSFRVSDVREFMITVYRDLRVRFPELPSEESFVEGTHGLELESPK